MLFQSSLCAQKRSVNGASLYWRGGALFCSWTGTLQREKEKKKSRSRDSRRRDIGLRVFIFLFTIRYDSVYLTCKIVGNGYMCSWNWRKVAVGSITPIIVGQGLWKSRSLGQTRREELLTPPTECRWRWRQIWPTSMKLTAYRVLSRSTQRQRWRLANVATVKPGRRCRVCTACFTSLQYGILMYSQHLMTSQLNLFAVKMIVKEKPKNE